MTKHSRFTFTLLAFLIFTAGCLTLSAQRRGAPPMLMTGTYELETTRGDSARQAADQATRNLPPGQRDRAYQDLLSRLQPPQTIAIERNGRSVTISSSTGPRVTFDADGRARSERFDDRRTMTTRADFVGDRLVVTSQGNRSTDFMVTFEPLNYGEDLLVTRQMDNDDLRRPVEIRSYYHRVSRDPRWDVYRGSMRDDRRAGPRTFLVPDGTRLVAVLDTWIRTRTSRSGERFSMTVQWPADYRDATINGVIGRITPYGGGHNTELRLYFDTIRMRGQSTDFEGVLSAVRMPGGVSLRVDAARDDDVDLNEKTLGSGAIGAALGAIIGAMAGGGKGAAVGAVVGGVGGVIWAQDREPYLDLPPGTEVTIIATSGRIR